MFSDFLGFGESYHESPKKAHEIAKEWRKEFYELDAQMTKRLRAIKMHPESYVMGFTIAPEAYYELEMRRAKYEMGLELQKILGSRTPCRIQAAFQRLTMIEHEIKKNKGKVQKREGTRIIFGRRAYGV